MSNFSDFTVTDLKRLLAAVAILQRDPSPDTIGQRVIAAARQVVGFDTGSLDVLSGGESIEHIWSDEDLERAFPTLWEPFVTLFPQHPLLSLHPKELATPRRFSDVTTRSELQRLELYNEVYHPLGVDWQLAFYIGSTPRHVIALNRQRVDFSDRDTRVLEALTPYLRMAIGVSATIRETLARCRALEHALEQRAEPVIVVTRAGRIVHATGAAVAALEACAGPHALAHGRLPEPLDRWLAAQLAATSDLPACDPVFRLEGEGAVVDVTLVPGHSVHTLVLRRREQLLLTPRETQILELVEDGLPNAAIATLCGISIRTVHKHLQRTFEKLNVETRGAAVRKWRDSER